MKALQGVADSNTSCLFAEAPRLPPADVGRSIRQRERPFGTFRHGEPLRWVGSEEAAATRAGERISSPAGVTREASAEEDDKRGRDRRAGLRLPPGGLRDQQQHVGLHLLPTGPQPWMSAQSSGGGGRLLHQTCKRLFTSDVSPSVCCCSLFKRIRFPGFARLLKCPGTKVLGHGIMWSTAALPAWLQVNDGSVDLHSLFIFYYFFKLFFFMEASLYHYSN